MKPFPVVTSTLSPLHLGKFVQERYALSAQTNCQLIKAGVNHTYLVTDRDHRFVFRVYSHGWRSRNEILEEIRLLSHLHQHGLSVSYPQSDAHGQTIQTLQAPEGERFAVLFSFAEGDKLQNITIETHHHIGTLMAHMHQLTQPLTLDRTTYTPDVLLVEPMERLQRFLPADCEEIAYMLRTQRSILQAWNQVDTTQIRTGVVHLDIWFDNLNINAQEEVTIFDFDFCGNGWLCLDFAYYILQVHSTERDETECNQKVDAFLKGYESVVPISAEEKRLIPLLGVTMYFFYLGIQCQRFDNWSNVFLNPTYLKRFINLLVKRYADMYGVS
jgi:Ser/Thr protein kinase RdoA (MazF antagonist)